MIGIDSRLYKGMNIAFVHTVFPGGGAERVTRDIAAGILHASEGDFSFFVYTPNIRHAIMTDEYSGYFQKISAYSRADEENEIMRMVEEDKIDVIVQIARRVNGIERIREKTGCKVILANHGEPFHTRYDIMLRKQRKKWRRLLWNLCMKRVYDDWGRAESLAVRSCRRDYDSCDVYTVLCEDYRRMICERLGIDEATSHIVAINNSEVPVEDVCYTKDKIILFSGRFELFSKRIDRLLRIWSKVMDSLPEWRLVLAGDGDGLEPMKAMAKELKLKNIEFAGYQEDMSLLYRKASVLCLTSQTEGWGLCLTEAQANGVIPIAFACTAAVRYILSPDRVNGFLVTPFDEDEFAATLMQVASMSEDEMMVLRRNVVEKSLSYSPEVISRQWKRVFDGLISR